MVTPLWLEYIAHKAISPSLIFIVTKMKSPEYWNLARVCSHRLKERPQEHEEQEIVYYQESYDSIVFFCSRSPYYDHRGVVDKCHHTEDEEHEKVTENFSWTHRQSSRHLIIVYIL